MRSRAVSFPALCSRSRRSGPPPASASSLRRPSSSIRLLAECGASAREAFSDKRTSVRSRIFRVENAYGKVRGDPYGAEQKNDAEQQFRSNSDETLNRRLDCRDVFGRNDERV